MSTCNLRLWTSEKPPPTLGNDGWWAYISFYRREAYFALHPCSSIHFFLTSLFLIEVAKGTRSMVGFPSSDHLRCDDLFTRVFTHWQLVRRPLYNSVLRSERDIFNDCKLTRNPSMKTLLVGSWRLLPNSKGSPFLKVCSLCFLRWQTQWRQQRVWVSWWTSLIMWLEIYRRRRITRRSRIMPISQGSAWTTFKANCIL